jgi:hypothetical protein
MAAAFIYQIYYTTPDALDPGFLPMDNSANERPDWFEYWPIRRFLLNEKLDDNSFYGFLSPKFTTKTNLDAAAAHAYLNACSDQVDVVLFSPSIHNAAFFLNVFEHGDSEHPGLLAVARRFFARIGRDADLDSLVCDSRNTVNSNYFIAKPRFWREWFALGEVLFAIAESTTDPLGAELRAATSYRGRREVAMKIFIMERLASWLLAREPRFVTQALDPFAARARIYKLPAAVVCDALKIAYTTSGRGQYRDVFQLVQTMRKSLNWRVRIGAALGVRPVRTALDALAGYWHKLSARRHG